MSPESDLPKGLFNDEGEIIGLPSNDEISSKIRNYNHERERLPREIQAQKDILQRQQGLFLRHLIEKNRVAEKRMFKELGHEPKMALISRVPYLDEKKENKFLIVTPNSNFTLTLENIYDVFFLKEYLNIADHTNYSKAKSGYYTETNNDFYIKLNIGAKFFEAKKSDFSSGIREIKPGDKMLLDMLRFIGESVITDRELYEQRQQTSDLQMLQQRVEQQALLHMIIGVNDHQDTDSVQTQIPFWKFWKKLPWFEESRKREKKKNK